MKSQPSRSQSAGASDRRFRACLVAGSKSSAIGAILVAIACGATEPQLANMLRSQTQRQTQTPRQLV